MSLILIVEDGQAMAEAAAGALQAAGYETAACLTVADGFSMCQERRPALVIAEYYINDGCGLDLLEKLNKLESPPPLIIATGCGQEEAAVRALALGAWDYCVKTEKYLEQLPGLADRCLADQAAKKAALEKETLSRRLEAQNELAGWLAHNFKNILAASIGYLNLIDFHNPDQSPDKRQEYLDDSRNSQESAIHLLEQLIRMTEADAGEAERIIVAEAADAAWELVTSKVLYSVQHNSPERLEAVRDKVEKTVFLNSARRVEPVNMVAADVDSILEAILQNALEAVLSAEEPRVLVLGEITGGALEITVKDNGRGMSENVLKHALEPLFSTKGEVGVGLSLSLVGSLVMRHGGDVQLKSTLGVGTTVKVRLPL
ncbi:MAG: hybrid sensor histidine kinase/response regulator [Candidatus Adiutrix sp.]|nr:hybrid sensor histidine kinase/response regulator [Candidatus Adiutrix sp.]